MSSGGAQLGDNGRAAGHGALALATVVARGPGAAAGQVGRVEGIGCCPASACSRSTGAAGCAAGPATPPARQPGQQARLAALGRGQSIGGAPAAASASTVCA